MNEIHFLIYGSTAIIMTQIFLIIFEECRKGS
jgi:hypothetical protein